MFIFKKLKKDFIVIASAFFIMSCSEVTSNEVSTSKVVDADLGVVTKKSISLDVYKNPNCGCCKKWISHIKDNNFDVIAKNRTDLTVLKQEKGIAPRYRSCHTAVSKDGYIFEGHVPAKFIQQFLLEKPQNSIGLSVPAMPVGSPGMEMGDRFMPYQVLLLKNDGSSEVYSMIQTYKEQF